MGNCMFAYVRDRINRYKWKIKNKNNHTNILNSFDTTLVEVKNYTYGQLRVLACNKRNKLYIGGFCSIAENVTFVLSADHNLKCFSSYPFKVMIMKEENEAISKGDIIVDDDVWIGYGATILSGVHVGQGAVIAAGAVVTKDVPPYAVVGGVPAKVIKYRFSEDLIKELLKVDFGKLTDDMIREHIDDLYTELTDIKRYDWLPRKNE